MYAFKRRAYWRPSSRQASVACLSVALATAPLAGCTSLPSSGPQASAVEREAKSPKTLPFRLVKYSAQASSILSAYGEVGMSTDGFFRGGGGGGALGAGDAISVTVIEPTSGGLFTGISSASAGGEGSKIVTLPDIQIDGGGMIVFPFVGRVKAAGKTPTQLGLEIESKLKENAVQPQVLVRLSANLANRVVVGGDVKAPGEFDITPAGETLLQLVTRAGGPAARPSDTVVSLTRGSTTRSVRLHALLQSPSSDIRVQKGDFINVSTVARTYLMLGASGTSAEFPLPAEPLSLAGALGRAGGLNDARADAKGIFVLRYEPRAIADQLAPGGPGGGAFVPVVYQFDMGSAGGFFLTDRFNLRQKDIVYLSNAGSVELSKMLDLFRMTVSPVLTGASIAKTGQSFGQ